MNNKPESAKADSAMLDKIGKILKLLNSNNIAEAQEEAEELGKYDMREIAA